MELQIDKNAAIPEQNLEEKLAWIGKITHVFSCDAQGRRIPLPIDRKDLVRIQVQNNGGGSSGQVYSLSQYEAFQKAYGVNKPEDLVGKPVVSVYKMPGPMLTGLIPLNFKFR